MRLTLFLLLFFLLGQCKSSESNLRDRRNDAGDIFSFSFDTSIGLELNFLGLSGGVYSGHSITGCQYSKCFLGSVTESSSTFLIFSGQKLKDDVHSENEEYEYYPHEKDYVLFLRKKNYYLNSGMIDKRPLNYLGRIKVRAGFIFGLSLEFNFLELVDFALGFAGIDFLEDDYNQYIEELIQNRKRERETGLKDSKLEKRK